MHEQSFQVSVASSRIADGHVAITLLLLSAITAYLLRGKNIQALATEARGGRLGEKFATWMVQNEDKLRKHPKLQPQQNNRSAGGAEGGLAGGSNQAPPKKTASNARNSDIEANVKTSKEEQVKINKKKGDDFANQETENFKTEANKVEKEITIKAGDGTKTRVDAIGVDKETGDIRIQEYKGSETAPLTKNQKGAFPQLEETGGEVLGKGKGAFPGGAKIPPTKIEIIRPPNK